MAAKVAEDIPTPGNWPVDPQHDVEIAKDRIWVDGCFDFAHHGMLLDYHAMRFGEAEGCQVTPALCYRRGG